MCFGFSRNLSICADEMLTRNQLMISENNVSNINQKERDFMQRVGNL